MKKKLDNFLFLIQILYTYKRLSYLNPKATVKSATPTKGFEHVTNARPMIASIGTPVPKSLKKKTFSYKKNRRYFEHKK